MAFEELTALGKMTERVDLLSSQGHKFLKCLRNTLSTKCHSGAKQKKKNHKVSLDTVIKQLILNLQKGVGVTFKSSSLERRFTTCSEEATASKRQEV